MEAMAHLKSMTYQKKEMVVSHSYDVKLLQSNKPKMALE
jgi:hypothetical protein